MKATFFLGLFVAPITAILLVEAFELGPSLSGWGYVVGATLASAGLLTKPWRQRRGLTRVGLGLMALVAVARLVFARGNGLDTLHLPGDGHRLVNRLVSERDGTLVAMKLLLFTGQLPRSDAREALPALQGAFDRLDAAEGAFATPAIATWLGLQSRESFDTVAIPPERSTASDVAFVSLHGFTGNFAVYCWQLSRAAGAISALTVCPSVGPKGDWWSPQGEQTLDRTLQWLARRGIRRVYLSGLSNGGVGASVLAERVSRSGLELRGLVLISGTSPHAPPPRVPVLLVQGRNDSMMPARLMRDYARQAGPRATYFEVDSGHFALLDRYQECERAIASWLRAQERIRKS
ncbi:alpha/beta hydrolase [Hyalangium versicolor]|uniref:alpha/beta hydrolase n=1 Tax=Hyalangium versicolor TaxID=2861190 RepID=UPI001CCBCF23|nr:alpha/beta hydrolase [Hyalangium versicolor]